MKYISILILFMLFSCQSSHNLPESTRINLTNNGQTIQVFNKSLVGQLVGSESFIMKETIYYDKDFNTISFSREGTLYPNYMEVFRGDGSYIGNIRIINTFSRGDVMFVVLIDDVESSITYKTNEFKDFSRPVILYSNERKISSIRSYGDHKWSMIFYEKSNIDLLIHVFRFIKEDNL